MKYFPDNTKVTLDDLESKGIYSEELIENLKFGKLDKLMELDEDKRENRDYMEPILYAVLEKFSTYEVYEYFGDKLKYELSTDEKLSKEIITSDPKLIEGSPIAENKGLILEVKDTMPEVIQYVSPKLDNDLDFLDRLCESDNPRVVGEAIEKYSVEKLIESNEELKSDEHFMAIAIAHDLTALDHADENILNSYDVFKEASENSQEVIDFAIENSEKLGLEAIIGVRDTVEEKVEEKYMEMIDENISIGKDNRFEKVKNKLEEKGDANPCKMRWVSALATKIEKVEPRITKETLDYSMLAKARLEKAMKADKDFKIERDDMLELITPRILNILVEKSNFNELDPNVEEKLKQYTEFYEEVSEKYNEQRRAKNQNKEENEKQAGDKNKEDKLRSEINGHSSPEDYEKAAKQWEEMKLVRDNNKAREVNLEK